MARCVFLADRALVIPADFAVIIREYSFESGDTLDGLHITPA